MTALSVLYWWDPWIHEGLVKNLKDVNIIIEDEDNTDYKLWIVWLFLIDTNWNREVTNYGGAEDVIW